MEHLALRPDVRLRILADANDKERIVPLVGAPWSGFDYVTFPADTSRQQMRWFLRDKPVAETFWRDAEIVYCTGESYVPTRSARLVVTAHDASFFEAEGLHHDAAFYRTRLKWTLLFRKLARRADMFHTVSNFSAERLAHHFPAIASRLRPIHNGVTPIFFGPPTAAGEQYLRDAHLFGRRYLLVPGGLHFRKNAELILEVIPQLLRRFPDLEVVVSNHAGPAYVQRARALDPRVRLTGFVTDDALRSLYGAAETVWFPSRYEGFGLPVVEAMACGTPVVASNAASIPEIAGDAAILRDPNDADAHLEAISSLLTDPRAREDFCRRGRIRAGHFTWEKTAMELYRNFETLL
jgi:glycosyltransferase involved in cell wall biosynthesis